MRKSCLDMIFVIRSSHRLLVYYLYFPTWLWDMAPYGQSLASVIKATHQCSHELLRVKAEKQDFWNESNGAGNWVRSLNSFDSGQSQENETENVKLSVKVTK